MKKTGFTLVELVITITILVILSTIAFVSFQSYTQDSRDANRLSSLNEIQKGLTLSYSKNGSFPTPKNATTYTGGTISLLQGTLTQEILPELQSDPKDPLSKSSYTYSTTSDGAYFQIASDIENTDVLSQTTPQQTYAKVSSALVKGNYKFDPSLPSLVVISTTSLTNSGIFSPDNCFVTNGGTNTIGNTTCTTKKQAGLKNTDSNLIGYWDMETLTGTQLLDLSGNGYNGILSGTLLPTQTGAYLGKGYYFGGNGLLTPPSNWGMIATSKVVNYNNSKVFSVSVLLKTEDLCPVASALSTPSYGMIVVESSTNSNFATGTFMLVDADYSNHAFKKDCQTSGNTKYDIVNDRYSIARSNERFIANTYKIITQVQNYTSSGGVKNKLYINGKLQNEFVSGYNYEGNISLPNDFLYMGSRVGGQASYKGIIDEVKIYNRALSDKEIEQQAKILGF